MRGFSNDSAVTLHVTRACNLQCHHCYQQNLGGFDRTSIDLEKAHKALSLLKPEGLIFYGGEPMLHPEILKEFITQYPHCRTAVITNGTIWNPEIFDLVDLVSVSLGSFRYDRAALDRPYSPEQFQTVLRIVGAYKEKLLVSHDIYPTHHDDDFYHVAALADIPVDTYPVVTSERDFILHSAYVPHLIMRTEPLRFPKLRILESGVITRDMRGIHNLADAAHWTEDMRTRPLPVYSRCEACQYLKTCPACLMFPAFVHDLLIADPEGAHHFCKMAAALSAYKSGWKGTFIEKVKYAYEHDPNSKLFITPATILRSIKLKKKLKLLDLGCGYAFLRDVLPQDAHYIGVELMDTKDSDVLHEDLRVAVERFEKGAFDCVVLSGIFRFMNSDGESERLLQRIAEKICPAQIIGNGSHFSEALTSLNAEVLPKLAGYSMECSVDSRNGKLCFIYNRTPEGEKP